MSGSSNADHLFTRCIVTLDAGISIAWAEEPNGSSGQGQRHHEQQEAGYRARLERAAAGIEVVFDELEDAGHVFTAPTDPRFAAGQRGVSGMLETCTVQLSCTPELGQEALTTLAARVAGLVALSRK